jgi:putative SOS response-associated peptidase YedK
MCNLYSVQTNKEAIRSLTKAMYDGLGNFPPLPGVFPDYPAPIVRNNDGERQMVMARWGMPSPAFIMKDKAADGGVTNVRNTNSPHWRRWTGLEHRCVVPFTSFSEYEATKDKKKVPVWFAANDERPLLFFAGIWTWWTGVRKVKEGEVTVDLFAFLTCDPNKEVGAIHPKAMPVILTTQEEVEHWLTAEWKDAKDLQRPLPDGALKIVAKGERRDGE